MKRMFSLLLALVLCLAPLASARAGNDYASLESAEILRRGNRGDGVMTLQKRLAALGYLEGAADGVFGADTEAAVSAFQVKNGFCGTTGCSGTATLFTQAVLFGDDNLAADAEGHINNIADGLYGLRSVIVDTRGGTMTSSFKFTNEGEKPIEAVCVIYWLADANNRVVSINGRNYMSCVLHGLNLEPNASTGITAALPATQKELQRASSLRFIIAEIAYVNGAVFVDYDATLSPYESDYYLAAEWH